MGEMVFISEQPTITVGLLGAGVPAEFANHPNCWTAFRLNEIERRILRLEGLGDVIAGAIIGAPAMPEDFE